MIQLKIKLFGAFRKYGNGEAIPLELSEPISISELKNALSQKLQELHSGFDQSELLNESVFADDTAILMQDTVIEKSGEVSVLPPVCGG